MVTLNHGRLPGKLYTVEIPTVATYSPEEMDLYGMPMSVINNMKFKKDYDSMSIVMLPLDKIIDIYSLGFPIRLIKRDEVNEVFTLLDDYVNDRRNENDYSLNRAKVNDERLPIIDRFAQEMFGINKINIVNSQTQMKNGYDLGIGNLLPEYKQNTIAKSTEPVNLNSRFGRRFNTDTIGNSETLPIVDQPPIYDNYNSISNNLSYLNHNTPTIDLNNVKRVSRYKINRDIE